MKDILLFYESKIQLIVRGKIFISFINNRRNHLFWPLRTAFELFPSSGACCTVHGFKLCVIGLEHGAESPPSPGILQCDRVPFPCQRKEKFLV